MQALQILVYHVHRGQMKNEGDDFVAKGVKEEKPDQRAEDAVDEDDIVESHIELDDDVVEPDNDPPQKVC